MVILPHQPLIMVDVNMPKEIYWLYNPSKGFVLYCTEKSIEEPTNPVWQLATCTWKLYKNRNMSKAFFDNVITPDGCLSMCLNCHGNSSKQDALPSFGFMASANWRGSKTAKFWNFPSHSA